MEVIYEDNHIIAVNKTCREIVQGDKTGDTPLSDMLKAWLKEKYCKPGNVFVGVTHRLDRPVSGVVLFAKTSKALARLNEMFRVGEVKKTYWAIVKNCPPSEEGELVNWLVRNEKQNKSYAYDTERPNAKKAILRYKVIARSENYYLLAVESENRSSIIKSVCQLGQDWLILYKVDFRNTDPFPVLIRTVASAAFPQCRIQSIPYRNNRSALSLLCLWIPFGKHLQSCRLLLYPCFHRSKKAECLPSLLNLPIPSSWRGYRMVCS